MKKHLLSFALLVLGSAASLAQEPGQQISPVNFSRVQITDAFWKPKLDKVATATLPACIYQTEVKTGRIRNFEKVARGKQEKHEGIYYDDSDVYKALEAIAYSLKNRPDAALELKADAWIDKIAAAQQPDGYLNTYYSLTDLSQRWTDMEKHEDYNAGHLLEAAVAYYNTTGKSKLLDVAIRFADHLDKTFRLANRPWVSGHQEIELALMKLYHLTKNGNYLKLADWYLQQRGRGYGKGVIWDQWKDPKYCQDEVPVKEQQQITGHAVRAMYLYTGAADVAAATHDAGYLQAMQRVWQDVVYRNMYITGGIGSSGRNEGFTTDYDLPNEQAYCETCASVGMVFWNQRMNLLTGQAQYVDVLERSLYNGALSGLSLNGDTFFYGNPLASSGQHSRREWFGTACCPSNISRLVASLGDYIYGQSPAGMWVNLFVASNTTLQVGKARVRVHLETAYPWQGQVKLTLLPDRPLRTVLHLRVPGWARNTPAPGDLYTFTPAAPASGAYAVKVNGKLVPHREEKGYFLVDRTWKKGDVVELSLPMEVKRIMARPELQANQDRVALQRGPLVYCVEGADNGGQAWNILLPDQAALAVKPYQVLQEQVIAVHAQVPVLITTAGGTGVETRQQEIIAIPYYAWANRGKNPMQVWLPRKVKEVKIND